MTKRCTFFATAIAATLWLWTMLQAGPGAVPAIAQTPQCPHATFGADGNMGPLFCVTVNPAAIRYFAPMAKHTFALGPDATPTQVVNALTADFKAQKTSLPILCSIYRLAAWRNQWRFGISIVSELQSELNFPAGWCTEPRFNDGQ
jgi:hypothetical protein